MADLVVLAGGGHQCGFGLNDLDFFPYKASLDCPRLAERRLTLGFSLPCITVDGPIFTRFLFFSRKSFQKYTQLIK